MPFAHDLYSKTTVAGWEGVLVVTTKPTGLSVSYKLVSAPAFKEEKGEGNSAVDVLKLHKDNLQLLDFRAIESDLNKLLAGTWQFASSARHQYALAQPAFTSQGDLIVKLIEVKKSIAPSAAAPAIANGSANGSAVPAKSNGSSDLLLKGAKLDLRECT